MRPKGTSEELERRRRLAVQKHAEGLPESVIARVLGVHPNSVSRWVSQARRGGPAALAAKPHPGAPPRLTPQQQREVLGWLEDSPRQQGLDRDDWHAPQVAWLIERRFGVRYNSNYLSGWLHSSKIRSLMPQRRARERDEARIQRWQEQDWPAAKKKDRRGGWPHRLD